MRFPITETLKLPNRSTPIVIASEAKQSLSYYKEKPKRRKLKFGRWKSFLAAIAVARWQSYLAQTGWPQHFPAKIRLQQNPIML